jgi:amidophosphoribosyltransferase
VGLVELVPANSDLLHNSVFSFIPNTAETSFYGMAEAAQKHLDEQKVKDIIAQKDTLDEKGLNAILEEKVRTEKIAIKDVKLRTFITEESSRDEMVAHVYDITYGVVKPTDNLVIIDDSIFRNKRSKFYIFNAILEEKVRTEKIAIKDVKLRTFITEDSSRDEMVAHVYDITYGVVKPTDNLVIIDDSIVRGTTLKQSIIKILDRLNPKKIVVVSSAPQIRYPDCYGIDMSTLEGFIAFRAALELLKDTNQYHIVDEVYKKCKAQQGLKDTEVINHVKAIYAPFTDEQISDKMAEMLTSKEVKAEVKIIFQKVEDLHKACPKNLGDWYFTGNYPTPGGNRVVNTAFINFYEGNGQRAY